MTDAPPVVALFGATALGKSDVALELAALLEADIVVADSMQVYAGLPIVTNQPGAEARAQSAVPPRRAGRLRRMSAPWRSTRDLRTRSSTAF